MNPKVLIGFLTRYAARLRFPQLFLLTTALFLVDMLIPDPIPFADEILLAMATLLLGSWQRERMLNEEPDDDTDATTTP